MTDLGSKLVRGTTIALIARSISLGLSAVIFAFLARLLEPEDFGTFLLTYSFVVPFGVAGALGLNVTVVREIAAHLGRTGLLRRVQKTQQLALLGSLASACVFVLAAYYSQLHCFIALRNAGLVELTAFWIVGYTINLILGETFRGFNDIAAASVFGGLATNTLVAIGVPVLWMMGRTNVRAAMDLSIGASMATACSGLLLLYFRVSAAERDAIQPGREFVVKSAMLEAWPLMIASVLSVSMSQIDLWVVSACRTNSDVALYGAAAKIANLIGTPHVVILSVIPPLIAELHASGRLALLQKTLRVTATLAAIPALIALVVVLLQAPLLLEIAYYRPYYRAASSILIVLVLGQAIFMFTGVGGMVLAMSNRPYAPMLVTIALSIYLATVGYYAASHWGPLALAAVSASGMVIHKLALLIYIRRSMGIWSHAYFRPSREDLLLLLRPVHPGGEIEIESTWDEPRPAETVSQSDTTSL